MTRKSERKNEKGEKIAEINRGTRNILGSR
jgi:hypothetical protein